MNKEKFHHWYPVAKRVLKIAQQQERLYWAGGVDRFFDALSLVQRQLLQVDSYYARLKHCETQGWEKASAECRDTLANAVERVYNAGYELRQVGKLPKLKKTTVKLADVLAELEACEKEFGLEVEYSRHSSPIIRMVTDSISLSCKEARVTIELGPFEISLTVGPRLTYEVDALEPNPAGADEDVTHPHVRNKDLCEGDAGDAINEALHEGRFLDFFTLVNSVLNTYNSKSPYVSLGDWDNSHRCINCGDRGSRDEISSCDSCEEDTCGSCLDRCHGCDAFKCSSCFNGSDCFGCEVHHCDECLCLCEDCSESFCSKCLKGGLCEPCRNTRDEEEISTPSPEPFEDELGLLAGAAAESG
jgi:hypothetical protein